RKHLDNEPSVGIDHLLVESDGLIELAFALRYGGTNQRCPQGPRLGSGGVLQMLPSAVEISRGSRLLGKLTVVVSDSRRLLAAARLDLPVSIDRFAPFALALVNIHEPLECRLRQSLTPRELGEQILRPIEQPRTEVVLGECKQCLMPLRLTQARAREQVLMDT